MEKKRNTATMSIPQYTYFAKVGLVGIIGLIGILSFLGFSRDTTALWVLVMLGSMVCLVLDVQCDKYRKRFSKTEKEIKTRYSVKIGQIGAIHIGVCLLFVTAAIWSHAGMFMALAFFALLGATALMQIRMTTTDWVTKTMKWLRRENPALLKAADAVVSYVQQGIIIFFILINIVL
jgi:hypothetical protein